MVRIALLLGFFSVEVGDWKASSRPVCTHYRFLN
jgi:hypothetical protein